MLLNNDTFNTNENNVIVGELSKACSYNMGELFVIEDNDRTVGSNDGTRTNLPV